MLLKSTAHSVDVDRTIQHDVYTGWTALHVAAHDGCALAVVALLEKHASVNSVNSNGETAMQVARRRGKFEVVSIIAEAVRTNDSEFVGSFAFFHSRVLLCCELPPSRCGITIHSICVPSQSQCMCDITITVYA